MFCLSPSPKLKIQMYENAETFIKNRCFAPASASASEPKCAKMLKHSLKIDALTETEPPLEGPNVRKC